ncbi:unnamed protein product [Ilex paraguariensis]|uniref:Uncharacterized protein n=1 Tax=Ilex paraguariensis TaxID=185542 RepID=A0ABC8R8M1_9AQUA
MNGHKEVEVFPSCTLNMKFSPELGSSFYVDHQFDVCSTGGISLDDECGLVRNKEPLDKGFSFDQESSKSWAEESEELEDNKASLRAQVVANSIDSSSTLEFGGNVSKVPYFKFLDMWTEDNSFLGWSAGVERTEVVHLA